MHRTLWALVNRKAVNAHTRCDAKNALRCNQSVFLTWAVGQRHLVAQAAEAKHEPPEVHSGWRIESALWQKAMRHIVAQIRSEPLDK
jgi:hypothetical protein